MTFYWYFEGSEQAQEYEEHRTVFQQIKGLCINGRRPHVVEIHLLEILEAVAEHGKDKFIDYFNNAIVPSSINVEITY